MRDTNVKTRNAALAKIEKMARTICARRKIKINFERLNIDPPALCDTTLVQMVSKVCHEFKIPAKKTGQPRIRMPPELFIHGASLSSRDDFHPMVAEVSSSSA